MGKAEGENLFGFAQGKPLKRLGVYRDSKHPAEAGC